MSPERLPPSAVWGTALGCTAWSVLLTVAFFGYGAADSALAIGLPSIALSVGIVIVMLLALDGIARRTGFRSRAWLEGLWGALLLFMGVLLLLVNVWIGPAMQAAGMVDGTGAGDIDPVIGVTHVPVWIPPALLGLGALLLVRVALACRGAGGATPAPDRS